MANFQLSDFTFYVSEVLGRRGNTWAASLLCDLELTVLRRGTTTHGHFGHPSGDNQKHLEILHIGGSGGRAAKLPPVKVPLVNGKNL